MGMHSEHRNGERFRKWMDAITWYLNRYFIFIKISSFKFSAFHDDKTKSVSFHLRFSAMHHLEYWSQSALRSDIQSTPFIDWLSEDLISWPLCKDGLFKMCKDEFERRRYLEIKGSDSVIVRCRWIDRWIMICSWFDIERWWYSERERI
jgi:hypothetical protein